MEILATYTVDVKDAEKKIKKITKIANKLNKSLSKLSDFGITIEVEVTTRDENSKHSNLQKA